MARLPLRYSIRNLLRRRVRTGLTIVGLALVVSAFVFILAFSTSLAATFRETGDPDNMIIISKKSQTFVLSSIADKDCDLIRNKLYDKAVTFDRKRKGAAPLTEPLISQDVYIGLNVKVKGATAFRTGRQRGIIHGIDPEISIKLNNHMRLVDGRLPRKGRRELIVGSTAATRIGVSGADLATGKELVFLNQTWKVVGRFEAPGTIMDCELITHVHDLRLYLKRQDFSFMKVKLKDPTRMAELCKQISTDEQFNVKAHSEQEYFADYAEGFDFFRTFAHALAIIIMVGGIVAGMNTMYTAVMGRVREIGTLQVIGFSKGSVLAGILTESIMIALTSGVMGCALGYLANGLPMKIPMAAFKVRVDWTVYLWALVAALLIGLIGAFIPAFRALRLRMVDAVRYQ
jgi:putative ABC transport system permease protein